MSASGYFVNGNGFLFKTLNPKDLARQSLKLITNKELRKKMGEVSLQKVKNYDIQKSVKMLKEVYYKALEKIRALPMSDTRKLAGVGQGKKQPNEQHQLVNDK